ncbi:B3 domain-containing protein REM13 [Cardamine amara subsp. amara]|uniref:B3 domain-containing protein REM13 n=1 Tax=Cardamine amara subsp. amara TaxID=228776 RepID=A0ABD1ACL5_CARAN
MAKSRTEVGFSSNNGDGAVDHNDDEDNMELHKNKKVKTISSEAEAASSSEADNSCFEALVTASDLRTDTLDLPKHFTSSINGLTTKCFGIVLTDGGERSWPLNFSFNESSDFFYISKGWRNFCDESGKKEGSFVMFKLLRDDKIPVLSFCSTELMNDTRQMECSEARKRESLSTELSREEMNIALKFNEEECGALQSLMEFRKNKNILKPRCSQYSSYLPCHKRFVTFTLPPDYSRIHKLCLPSLFVRDNGINKPGEIYLSNKNGKKWLTNLLLDKKGTMALGKGWKEFVNANVLKTSFTLKLIWEDTTPVLSLCGEESTRDREHC